MIEKREFYINGKWVAPETANDHQVIDPGGGHQTRGRAHIGVSRIVEHGVAAADIAVFIAIADVPQGRPGADITPTALQRHDHRRIGLLHQRVVD